MPTSAAGQVDLNLIPSILVDRTEVITGGASAAWGSDAVAGVVNLILKKSLQGVQGEASYGQSRYNDDVNYKGALAVGTYFQQGRGHILIGGEYVRDQGAFNHDARQFFNENRGSVNNTGWATNGLPAIIYSTQVTSSASTAGGLITNGPLRGIAFGPGGAPYNFQFGALYGTSMIGGVNDHENGNNGLALKVPVTRGSAMVRIDYDLLPNVKSFLEAAYEDSGSVSATAPPRNSGLTGTPPASGGRITSGTGSFIVNIDNPYLPASVRNLMVANKITSFYLGRVSHDIGSVAPNVDYLTRRMAVGLSGEFRTWKWNAYYQYGLNVSDEKTGNRVIAQNFYRASDPVVDPSSGAIVCRDSLSAVAATRTAAAGCVPYNLFGPTGISGQARDYILGTATNLANYDQHVIAGNVQGEPFRTWAGAVSVAVGLEGRWESVKSETDAISRSFGFTFGNPQPIQGSLNVKEVYAETLVPILADLPFAKSFNLDAAVRHTEYSTSGGVTTWKIGGNFAINDQVRLRVSQSRDIRAPSLSELYTSAVTTASSPIDRFNLTANAINLLTSGNPSLKPEQSSTFSGGISAQPAFAQGLRLSVDYYNIKIDGQIAALGAQGVIDRCYAGATEFCAYLTRGANGLLTTVRNPQFNLNQFRTSGVDIEVSYSKRLSAIYAPAPGNVSLRFLSTYVHDLVTVDSAGTVDRAGQLSGTGVPHWLSSGSATYSVGRLSLTYQGRYVGGGAIDNTYKPGTATGSNINSVESRYYTSLSAQYDLRRSEGGKRLQVFAVVDNVFNVQPPFPFDTGIYYDILGTSYRTGLRFTF